jgi:hypothetical protein
MVTPTLLKGKDRKQLTNSIIKFHYDRADQLLVYCRVLGPNPMQTLPTWTAAAVGYW